MELKQLIAIADSAYPDGLVGLAAHGEPVGDGLAEFIARELRDTFDESITDSEQFGEAMRVLGIAIRKLGGVHSLLLDYKYIAGTPDNELPLLMGKYKDRPCLQEYLERRLKDAGKTKPAPVHRARPKRRRNHRPHNKK